MHANAQGITQRVTRRGTKAKRLVVRTYLDLSQRDRPRTEKVGTGGGKPASGLESQEDPTGETKIRRPPFASLYEMV